MDFPEEIKYSKEHIWVRIENDSAVIGITDYAQQELGIITAVELPEEGDELEQDDSFGSLEARKTVADLYAPFSGVVRSVNHDVLDNPGLINDDPYDSGWLIEVSLDEGEELKWLMSADDYSDYAENSD
jgi:glycine cleavage system H protein